VGGHALGADVLSLHLEDAQELCLVPEQQGCFGWCWGLRRCLSSLQRAEPVQRQQHDLACLSFTDKDPDTPRQAFEPASPTALACHRSCLGASRMAEEPAAAANPTTHPQGLRQWRLRRARGRAAAFWGLVFVGGFTLQEVHFWMKNVNLCWVTQAR